MADAVELRRASVGRTLPLGVSFGNGILLLGCCAFLAIPIAAMCRSCGEGSLREELFVTSAVEVCLLGTGTLVGSRI